MLSIDTKINDKQLKQFSLAISIDDILNCIRNDYDSYFNFLKDELKNKNITYKEYKKELNLIQKLKKGELINES